jgi:hypothetical protein
VPLAAYLHLRFGQSRSIAASRTLLAALIAYTHQPQKPSLKFEDMEMALMTVLC